MFVSNLIPKAFPAAASDFGVFPGHSNDLDSYLASCGLWFLRSYAPPTDRSKILDDDDNDYDEPPPSTMGMAIMALKAQQRGKSAPRAAPKKIRE